MRGANGNPALGDNGSPQMFEGAFGMDTGVCDIDFLSDVQLAEMNLKSGSAGRLIPPLGRQALPV